MRFKEEISVIKELEKSGLYSNEKIQRIVLSVVRKYVNHQESVYIFEDGKKVTANRPYAYYVMESRLDFNFDLWKDFYKKRTGFLIASTTWGSLTQIICYITRNFDKLLISVEYINYSFIITFHDSVYKFELNPDSKAGFKYKKLK